MLIAIIALVLLFICLACCLRTTGHKLPYIRERMPLQPRQQKHPYFIDPYTTGSVISTVSYYHNFSGIVQNCVMFDHLIFMGKVLKLLYYMLYISPMGTTSYTVHFSHEHHIVCCTFIPCALHHMLYISPMSTTLCAVHFSHEHHIVCSTFLTWAPHCMLYISPMVTTSYAVHFSHVHHIVCCTFLPCAPHCMLYISPMGTTLYAVHSPMGTTLCAVHFSHKCCLVFAGVI